jgi:GNAT superfamily N-acetyltransferase
MTLIDIVIRPATRVDIPALVDFQQRLATETESLTLDPVVLTQGMEAMFHDPTKGSYFVAVANGQIVGCHMVTYEWSDWRNGMVYWLQSVYVRQDFRKHGVFREMFNTLKARVMNDAGVKGLRLYVDKSNSRAQKVYTAMGMNGDHYSVFEIMK